MVEETPIFDGNHGSETIACIALEEGTITDGGQDIGQAGTVQTGPIWTRVTFPDRFDTIPVVVASSATVNDNEEGTVRIRNVDISGFDVRFEEYGGGNHPLETISWIAMKPGTHTLDGKPMIAGSTSANENYSSVSLSGFSTTPVILTQIQSYHEGDYASHTRVNNTTPTSFNVKIEEQNDTLHTHETIGYIVIEPTILRSGAAKVEETKYYPYGVIQEGGSEKYLYTGKEMDKGTGLYYYEARYYDPETGRFIQADPVIPDYYNPQSLNRYAYVVNNPLRYVDPSGNVWVETEREYTKRERHLLRLEMGVLLLLLPEMQIGKTAYSGYSLFRKINKISGVGRIVSPAIALVINADEETASDIDTALTPAKTVGATGTFGAQILISGDVNKGTAKEVGRYTDYAYQTASFLDLPTTNGVLEFLVDTIFPVPSSYTEKKHLPDYGTIRLDVDYNTPYFVLPQTYDRTHTYYDIFAPVSYENGGGTYVLDSSTESETDKTSELTGGVFSDADVTPYW